MSNQIAKRYVSALMKSCSDSELTAFFDTLKELSKSFGNEKFLNIISSPDVNSSQREEFILSINENKDEKFINFLKLLNQNDRLELIPAICDELEYRLAIKNNSFEGLVLSDFEISEEQLKSLEESFSKKFDSTIKLKKAKESYPGVKVEIDDLGLEVSFSLERLKAQMAEHILKAI